MNFEAGSPGGVARDAFKAKHPLGSGTFKNAETGHEDTFALKPDEVGRCYLLDRIRAGGTLLIVALAEDEEVAATYFGARADPEANRLRLDINFEPAKGPMGRLRGGPGRSLAAGAAPLSWFRIRPRRYSPSCTVAARPVATGEDNASMAHELDRRLDVRTASDNFVTRCPPHQAVGPVELESRCLAEVDPQSLRPAVDDSARDELKFGEWLPIELADRVVQ